VVDVVIGPLPSQAPYAGAWADVTGNIDRIRPLSRGSASLEQVLFADKGQETPPS